MPGVLTEANRNATQANRSAVQIYQIGILANWSAVYANQSDILANRNRFQRGAIPVFTHLVRHLEDWHRKGLLITLMHSSISPLTRTSRSPHHF